MRITDKKNVLKQIETIENLTIELGCGNFKKDKSAICIDAIDYECVDIVGDVFDVLEKIPDHQVSAVSSYHFFEHVEDIEAIMDELGRIMKENGSLVVVTPHFSNPYFYSDYTHKKHFGLYTFSYLTEDLIFSRKVPTYDKSSDFELRRVKLIFKSPRPFYFRWGVKKLFEILFNLNRYAMEFYEENLCYLFPCYEIRYEMRRK